VRGDDLEGELIGMQVTIIGGGSYQWSPKLITDLLAVAPLADMHLVLEDIDPAPLPKMEAYARLANEKMGTKMTVETTTDQRRAVEGADFVIVTISTGGFESMGLDIDIPAAHGIRQSVGDSVGPGGISRSLRNIPVLVGIGRDMEQGCPDAWMLNITNPMTCLTRSVCRETAIKTVGLCHEVGHFCMDLAIAFAQPHTAIRPTVVGVNHFPVITALEIDGADGLALLRDMVDELGGLEALRPGPKRPEAEPFTKADFAQRHALKLTLLDRYGAIPGAGDRHVAEFIPSALTEESGWGETWGVELTPMARRLEHQEEYIAEVDRILAGTDKMQTWDSGEIVAPVIDSLLTGTARELPVNLPNRGQCPDLPADAVVESICVVDGDGMRGRDTAHAPVAITEWVRRQVAVQELTVEAAVTGDRRTALQAFALDPLAGRGDLCDIEAMADELLAATARWLPQFAQDAPA
jgi:alpha-galactosidase